jgi:transcriptional regulator with XRE-family HTH domain
MPPKNPQLAAFIREHRRARGLSMQQLADRVGVTKSNLHYWETGEFTPKPAMLEPLAQALDVSYEDLFAVAGIVRPDGLPEFVPYLRSKLRDLPDDAAAEAERWYQEFSKRHRVEGGDDDEPDH